MDFIYHIFGFDLKTSILLIFNLILIESLLSIDNAAVLATMVMDLPENKRKKALRYGILGAYLFRGLCLLVAVWLVNIWWLKPLAGFYLIFIGIKYFLSKSEHHETSLKINNNGLLFTKVKHIFGQFGTTIILVEIMDLAFSMDNIFAAAAFSDRIYVVIIGVFIGILSMRFAAQFLINLVSRFPLIKDIAFFVIIILGIKLCISLPCQFLRSNICRFLHSEASNFWFSILALLLFATTLVYSYLNNKNTPLPTSDAEQPIDSNEPIIYQEDQPITNDEQLTPNDQQ